MTHDRIELKIKTEANFSQIEKTSNERFKADDRHGAPSARDCGTSRGKRGSGSGCPSTKKRWRTISDSDMPTSRSSCPPHAPEHQGLSLVRFRSDGRLAESSLQRYTASNPIHAELVVYTWIGSSTLTGIASLPIRKGRSLQSATALAIAGFLANSTRPHPRELPFSSVATIARSTSPNTENACISIRFPHSFGMSWTLTAVFL